MKSARLTISAWSTGGTRPELARVSVARKLAAAALAIWQRKEEYEAKKFFATA